MGLTDKALWPVGSMVSGTMSLSLQYVPSSQGKVKPVLLCLRGIIGLLFIETFVSGISHSSLPCRADGGVFISTAKLAVEYYGKKRCAVFRA